MPTYQDPSFYRRRVREASCAKQGKLGGVQNEVGCNSGLVDVKTCAY